MKVLWFINTLFPKTSEALSLPKTLSMGWLFDMAEIIAANENINLYIATAYPVKEMKKVTTDTAIYYVMPRSKLGAFGSTRFYERHIETIYDEVKPDIVHLHGTENSWGSVFIKKYPQIPALLTIQGVICRISKEYSGGLSILDMLVYRTFLENIRFGGMLGSKLKFMRQTKVERNVIQNIKHVTGRTFWHYAVVKSINPDINYYLCNYNLREEFYSAPKWDVNKIERHSIYTSAASYPLKGLHILIQALSIVKKTYHDVKVYVPGVASDNRGNLIVNSGYKKYINKQINELGLKDNLNFMGNLSADKVIKQMLQSNAVVVPSAIEGASATICEGMYLGVPCICSCRGGMTDLLQVGITGFITTMRNTHA